MSWAKDLTGVEAKKKGTFRSLNGAADENIFQGRASKAGFYCFFKVWRDMPYDAVLDHEGVLYRIEVKGSSGDSFDLTRGSRSGQQIIKSISRTRPISRMDCDFVVAVDSNNGDCYILPEDVVEIAGEAAGKHFKLKKQSIDDFKEKWKLMMSKVNSLNSDQTRDGLRKMPPNDLAKLAQSLGVSVPSGDLPIKGTRMKITKQEDKTVFLIWQKIAQTS